MNIFIVAIVLALLMIAALLHGGVGAISAVFIIAAVAGGIYLFRHTRRA